MALLREIERERTTEVVNRAEGERAKAFYYYHNLRNRAM